MTKKQTDVDKNTALVKQLLALEAEADIMAAKSDWKGMPLMNARIDEVKARLRARGLKPEKIIAEATGYRTSTKDMLAGKKGVSTEAISDKWDKPWNDDLLDTGYGTGSTTKFDWSKYSKGGSQGSYAKCAHSHPLLTIGDDKLTIQGGSCYTPQGKYDVEIFLCAGASTPKVLLPWGTTYVRIPIVDMQAPDDKETFDKVIDWTIEQMREGKKVHVGCIGGHGRTGVFLSVLVHRITGETDVIEWLRTNYCKKAVESATQINWLHKHYGIVKAKATKGDYGSKTNASTKSEKNAVSQIGFGQSGTTPKRWEADEVVVPSAASRAASIWGTTQFL